MNATKRDGRAARWGRIIRERREMCGLSQGALADKLGLTQAAISAWERGIQAPSWANLDRVRTALGLPWAVFLDEAA